MHQELSDRGPRWRTLLEDRWRTRLMEVTELSLAYHDVARAGRDQEEARRLLRRGVRARRNLADIEEALGRLAAGEFGHCESCGAAISTDVLRAVPEARYCPWCEAEHAPGTVPAALA